MTPRSDAESITPAMRDNLDDELTEVKSENAVDRITSQANPRTLERVPAGAKFRVRMVIDILCDEDKPLFARVVEGLRLLEDDALGGGGSRGSGRVRLGNMRLVGAVVASTPPAKRSRSCWRAAISRLCKGLASGELAAKLA